MIDVALLLLIIAAALICGARMGASYVQAGHTLDSATARFRRGTDVSDAADAATADDDTAVEPRIHVETPKFCVDTRSVGAEAQPNLRDGAR